LHPSSAASRRFCRSVDEIVEPIPALHALVGFSRPSRRARSPSATCDQTMRSGSHQNRHCGYLRLAGPAPRPQVQQGTHFTAYRSRDAATKMNWSNETRRQISWRSAFIVGSCLALVYYALMEFHGDLAPRLLSIGIAAVGTVWAKVWLEPESQRPATRR
jgi:hypothetical protein